jgi:hypothetical protein
MGRLDAPRDTSHKPPSAELKAVLDAYALVALLGLSPGGHAAHYRQIRPSGWPAGLHYEFLKTSDAIGVEIHVESEAALSVSSTVESFARRPLGDSGRRLQWESAWTYGPRLFVKFPLGAPPGQVASAMAQLIEMTLRTITFAL